MGERGLGLGLPASRWRSSGAGAHGGDALGLPTGSQRPAQGLHGQARTGRRRRAAEQGVEGRGAGDATRTATGARGSTVTVGSGTGGCCGMAGDEEQTIRSWRSSPDTSPEKEKRTGNGQTVMYSIKGIRYGEENDEVYLVVVVIGAETRWFGRKSSPKSLPET